MYVKSSYLNKVSPAPSITLPIFKPSEFFKEYLSKYKSFTAIITGCRASGKTNILKHFMISQKGGALANKFNMIVIFSRTIMNGQYKFLNTKLVFKEYKPDVVEMLKEMHQEYKEKGKDFRSLVLIDDLAGGNIKWQDSIQQIFFEGRHHAISLFYLTQKCSEAAQTWKANTNLFVIMKTLSRKEKNYIGKDIIVDAIENQLPEDWKETQMEKAAMLLQGKIIKDFNAIIVTPFNDEIKIWQYKAPYHK